MALVRRLVAPCALAVAVLLCSSCSPGDGPCPEAAIRTVECGSCGTSISTCVDGSWSEYSACTGEGVCAPGAEETAACGTDVGVCAPGTATRVCHSGCGWGNWGACGGSYVGPVPEVPGNGLDDDCDGVVDELPGWIEVPGQITKLVASPGGAIVYALDAGTPSSVVVLDAALRAVVASIPLPQVASDMDLSPNGLHLVVAHPGAQQVSKIDVASKTVSFTRDVASDPYRIEVDDAGVIYYAEFDQWADIRRVNATVDFASDTLLGFWAAYAPDIELSPDGASLYVGESGISGGHLQRYDVSAGGFSVEDTSTWDDGYGFPYPSRHLYVGPDGKRAYYASHQLDAGDLAFTVGSVENRILAEDAAGALAVGPDAVLDAQTLRKIGALPTPAAAAVFANGDTELCYYDSASGRVSWIPKGALGDDAVGLRELAGEPLSSYTFTRLVHDRIRARLYGLDATRNLVVAIDTGTLLAVGAVVTGSAPSDLAQALAGDALYVGHLETLAVERIDLTTFTFDGFIVVPRDPYEVEPLSSGRLAINDQDQWTKPTLIDPSSGAVVATLSAFTYAGALAATADGNSLFVGEAGLSGSDMTRYAVGGGTFTQVGKTSYDGGYGFPYPARSVVALPDGSGAYYAQYLIDGSDLSVLLYAQPDAILTVTPDGLLATSSTKVYQVSDGALLGSLSATGTVQAVSPDGATLYVVTAAGIATVDLGSF